jgi:hypothetical protein
MAKETAKKTKDSELEAQARIVLAKELKSLIPKLDSEGLTFLIQQARIHLYNMKVDELNKVAVAADKSTVKLAAQKRKSAESTEKKFQIKGTESGSSFYLYYGNNNAMLSKSEMTHLIKMANAGGTDMEVRERFYRWIERERKDIFAVITIKNKFDECLKTLAAYIKKNYTLE